MQTYADLYAVPHSHACAQMHTCAHSHSQVCARAYTHVHACVPGPLGTESLYSSEQGTFRGGLLIGSRFITKV